MSFAKPTEPIFDTIPVEAIDYLSVQQRALNILARQDNFAIRPPSPRYVKVTNRKGGLSIQFVRVPDADGYEVSVATDPSMTNLQYRQVWEGNRNTSGFVSLGQVDSTFSVRVRSRKGTKFSKDIQGGPCGISQITGTAGEITAGAEIPPAQPVLGDESSGTPFGGSRQGLFLE